MRIPSVILGAVVGGLAGLALSPLLGIFGPMGGLVVGALVGARPRRHRPDLATGSTQLAHDLDTINRGAVAGARWAAVAGAAIGLVAGVAVAGWLGAMIGASVGTALGAGLGRTAGQAAGMARVAGPATAVGAALGLVLGAVHGFRLGASFGLVTQPFTPILPVNVVTSHPAAEGLRAALLMAGLDGFLGAGLGFVVDSVIRRARRP